MKMDIFIAVAMVLMLSGPILSPLFLVVKRLVRSRNQVCGRAEKKNTPRQAILPSSVASGQAIICEWDKNGKPRRAMFRSGTGQPVTAPIAFIDLPDVCLQHRKGQIFRRRLVGGHAVRQ